MDTDVFGLVMTGGGARGAYQAGVLKRIGELYSGKPIPFPVIAGASAGAINGIVCAAEAADFGRGMERLAELWGNIETKRIFRTDVGAVSAKAGRWIADLSFGGFIGGGKAQSLLDARPLRKLLSDHVDFAKLKANVDSGILRAVTVVATNYSSGKSFIFVQGKPGLPLWTKSRRISLATDLTADHVLASAAIPILFQPVFLETAAGNYYFGDGCVRLTSPLSPAIRLGANRLLAIGVRSHKPVETGFLSRPAGGAPDPSGVLPLEPEVPSPPPVAQIMGVILNAIFLDHLDTDVEHLRRLNELLATHQISESRTSEPLRKLSVLSITPSVDLGDLALNYASKVPPLLRYMLRGLGTKESETSDLISYLLFEAEYARALLDIGYRDANARIDEIRGFLGV